MTLAVGTVFLVVEWIVLSEGAFTILSGGLGPPNVLLAVLVGGPVAVEAPLILWLISRRPPARHPRWRILAPVNLVVWLSILVNALYWLLFAGHAFLFS